MLKYILIIYIWAICLPLELLSINQLESSILREVESINIAYDPNSKKFVPSKIKKAHIVGGFSQNVSDAEDVERSIYEKALRFFERIKEDMLNLAANINNELENQDHKTLEQYKSAAALLKESLATMHSLEVVKNNKDLNYANFSVDWYTNATLKEKYYTKKIIQKNMNQLFKNEITSKKVKNKKIDANIEQLEVDLLMQKFVTENTNVIKLLKEHESNNDYISPMHTDVCGQLGSIYASYMFEKTFKNSIGNGLGFFKKYLPYLKFRIQTMTQNGTLLLLEKRLDDALHSFKQKTAELMQNKFGFNDMCNEECLLNTTKANYYLEKYEKDFKPTNTLQRRGDLTKLLLYYYRDQLYNIEATADFILIMLLYLSSATELSEKGFLDSSSLRTSDRFNLINKTIEKNKRTKKEVKSISFKKIAPFNFFREEPEEKSGNESILAIDDIMKTCSLAKRSKHYNSLFEITKNLWVDIQNMYSASYGFVEAKKVKIGKFVGSRIRNVGFLFRWFSNNKPVPKNINFLVEHFSPLLSLSLQLTFFISTMIENYESSFLSSFSAVLRKIFTLGRNAAQPKNYDDLVRFSESNYLLKHAKVDKAQRIITQLVTMLKKKFLSLPFTPTLLAQFISILISLWVFENQTDISLSNPNVSRFKKLFFLTYFVHNNGPVEKAVDIIYGRCKAKTDKIVLGCIHDYGGIEKKKFFGLINTKCKPIKISMKKRSIRKILKVLMASLTNPLDILKIAVDTATRCDYFGRSPTTIDNKKKKKKRNKVNYDIFIKSELSLRYICATVTKKIVQKIIKDVSRLKDMSQAQGIIDQTLNSIQYLKIKNYRDESSSVTILCPFMEGNDKSIRDLERSQITFFVYKNVGLLNVLKGKITNLFKKSITTREGIKSDSSIYIKVGARKFNGLLFTGGFHLNVENTQHDTLHIEFSESRIVYDGKQFVDELDILKKNGIKMIEMKGINDEYERYYVVSEGKKISEFDYAIQNPEADIIVFDGYNYISSSALRRMGIENERLVWAGNSMGWVAEFALSIVTDNPVPIFDGNAWILLDKLSVKSILGEHLPKDVDGSLLANNMNFVILNKKGKEILIDNIPVINLKYATLTLSGILNFVTKAEKGKGNQIIVHTRIP